METKGLRGGTNRPKENGHLKANKTLCNLILTKFVLAQFNRVVGLIQCNWFTLSNPYNQRA